MIHDNNDLITPETESYIIRIIDNCTVNDRLNMIRFQSAIRDLEEQSKFDKSEFSRAAVKTLHYIHNRLFGYTFSLN